jgi:signal transduction histidine kinase
MATSPGGLVGVMNVHTRLHREFTDRDVRLLTSIGTLVAGVIHQARLHRRLAVRERAHERFTEQVIAAQEAERRRLAADIHDGITQRLCSLRFHLDAAAGALPGSVDVAAAQLVYAQQLADLTFDEARAAINDLRPPVLDDLGLADGLTSLARSIAGVEVVVDADECELPDHVEIALYRIAQEALQNVVKHAGCTTTYLTVRASDREVVLQVADDGRGFDREAMVFSDDPATDRYGMTSMEERAELIGGRLEVRSRPGEGTTVTARVPLTGSRTTLQ